MRWWMVGFVIAVLMVSYCASLPTAPVAPVLMAGAGLLLLLRSTLGDAASGAVFGCALAIAHGQTLLEHRLRVECVKLPVTVEGVVVSLPAKSTVMRNVPRQRFEFRVQQLQPQRCVGPKRLLLSYYGDASILPGERWRFTVSLKKPWGLANPGSHNAQAWFAAAEIDGVGSVRSPEQAVRLGSSSSVRLLHQRIRYAISERIERLPLSRDARGILRAITVADKNGIDTPLWETLQFFGINHLLVISGLHIGLVAALGVLLGKVLLRIVPIMPLAIAWLPSVLGLALACAYAALAGFTLPTQRALCMLASCVVAQWFGRPAFAPRNLLLAAAVVLFFNPLAALGSGFWLSFSAVAALLWFAAWQRQRQPILRAVSTQVFISLAMLPLSGWFFGGGSLLAAVANLIMIPLVGFVVVPLALLASVLFLLGVTVAERVWLWSVWPLEKMLPLAHLWSKAQLNGAYVSLAGSLSETLLALAVIALLVVPFDRKRKALLLLGLLPFFLPSSPRPSVGVDDLRVTLLDVGQGTAVLVRAGQRALLYDTGGGDPLGRNLAQSVILPYLRSQGVDALDTFVVSHADNDHSAGASTIVQALTVTRLRYGGAVPGLSGGRRCIAGEAWRWPGGSEFQFLSPGSAASFSSNDSSCVLQIHSGGQRWLLSGDIERGQERALVAYWGDSLRSDWLLAAHHGSKTSSTWIFLKHVRASFVAIGNGYANRFGHPHPTVRERVLETGSQVHTTAASGALDYAADGKGVLRVTAHREVHARYWMQ